MGILYVLYVTVFVIGSGISWAICKSAPRPRQIATPVPLSLRFLQAGCPSCHLTNSVKTLKAKHGSDKPTDIGLGAQIR